MDGLKCSEEEAREILEYDKTVDRMKDSEVNNDLTPEQKKTARKYARTGTRKAPVSYKWDKKERKADVTKEGLIEALKDFLVEYENIQNVEIVNKSREVSFLLGEESFSLTLIRHTKKKKGG